MEHVRYEDLDAICEGIGDSRRDKNAAVTREKEYMADAIPSMQEHKVTVYKHGGVELILVPGDTKVRARLIKDDEGDGADLPSGDAPTLDPEAGDVL